MDPTEIQADKSNDSHSLEQSDGSEKKAPAAPADSSGLESEKKNSDPNAIDATGGATDTGDKKPPKVNPLKKFWRKFNLYLMLFILVVVVAVGILVALTIKSNQQTKGQLDTENLSQQELQQLANTDVTVGNNKQLLTVQANAVFAGSVLVRSSLEVAGSLKVGGSLSLNSLVVTGSTQLSDTTTNNLTVSGALNVLGALALKNGISVSGNSNFTGNVTTASLTTGTLNLNGDLALTHHIAAGGPTPGISRGTATGGGGTVSLSGSDTSGSVTVNTGASPPAGCFATISFSQKFTGTPHVVITPVGSSAAGLQYYIERSTGSFSICASNSAPASSSFGFDYMAFD
jgi:cytoskeletal protein CcmA (bactofilin family)